MYFEPTVLNGPMARIPSRKLLARASENTAGEASKPNGAGRESPARIAAIITTTSPSTENKKWFCEIGAGDDAKEAEDAAAAMVNSLQITENYISEKTGRRFIKNIWNNKASQQLRLVFVVVIERNIRGLAKWSGGRRKVQRANGWDG